MYSLASSVQHNYIRIMYPKNLQNTSKEGLSLLGNASAKFRYADDTAVLKSKYIKQK